jgi:hypothetical protein
MAALPPGVKINLRDTGGYVKGQRVCFISINLTRLEIYEKIRLDAHTEVI